MISKTLEERFWEKVKVRGPDECWEWIGAKIPSGYGTIRGHGKVLKAHRVAWELHYGSIPKGKGWHGICVLHSCDNRGCVNPAHLFLGTQADNIHDMMQKGRDINARGEANGGGGKLTEPDVCGIRYLLDAGYLQREIAEIYKVNQITISNIKTGRSWGWLKCPKRK